MSFHRELAYELRQRGLGERQITDILREVDAHVHATGDTPEEAFGTPEEYAENFPARKVRTRGVRITTVAAVLGIAYVPAAMLLRWATGIDLSQWTGGLLIWPAVAVMAVGVLAGFLVDYLRPPPRRR